MGSEFSLNTSTGVESAKKTFYTEQSPGKKPLKESYENFFYKASAGLKGSYVASSSCFESDEIKNKYKLDASILSDQNGNIGYGADGYTSIGMGNVYSVSAEAKYRNVGDYNAINYKVNAMDLEYTNDYGLTFGGKLGVGGYIEKYGDKQYNEASLNFGAELHSEYDFENGLKASAGVEVGKSITSGDTQLGGNAKLTWAPWKSKKQSYWGR